MNPKIMKDKQMMGNSRQATSSPLRATRRCTMNPLQNDIRYNSKIRYNVNSVYTKISGIILSHLRHLNMNMTP